ncbi:MAG: diguanylate cyclase [Actinomycetota bacterium]|nr:diguanylate cyclase [Actinomycetota bacterium]
MRATLSYPITLVDRQERVDVSIGYARLEPAFELSQAMRQADLAMYEAKRSGCGSLLWQGQD